MKRPVWEVRAFAFTLAFSVMLLVKAVQATFAQ